MENMYSLISIIEIRLMGILKISGGVYMQELR